MLALQVPLSMGFSRQEYWIELPFSPLGNLLDPQIEPASPASHESEVYSSPLSHLGSPIPRGVRVHSGASISPSLARGYTLHI